MRTAWNRTVRIPEPEGQDDGVAAPGCTGPAGSLWGRAGGPSTGCPNPGGFHSNGTAKPHGRVNHDGAYHRGAFRNADANLDSHRPAYTHGTGCASSSTVSNTGDTALPTPEPTVVPMPPPAPTCSGSTAVGTDPDQGLIDDCDTLLIDKDLDGSIPAILSNLTELLGASTWTRTASPAPYRPN